MFRGKIDYEMVILAVLAAGPMHGYEISTQVAASVPNLGKSPAGTLYPLLHRLEKEGFLSAEWQIQEGKPNRKVYALTDSGRERLKDATQEWRRFSVAMDGLLGGA